MEAQNLWLHSWDSGNEMNDSNTRWADVPLPHLTYGPWQTASPSDSSDTKEGRIERLQELSGRATSLLPPLNPRHLSISSHGPPTAAYIPWKQRSESSYFGRFFILHFIHHPDSHSRRISNCNSHLASEVRKRPESHSRGLRRSTDVLTKQKIAQFSLHFS